MRCFNHPTYEAAGVCRNCGRGICHDCIAVVEDAIACKGKCESRVGAIQRMVANNQVTYRSTARQMWQGGLWAVFAGILFGVMGGIFIDFVDRDFAQYLGGSLVALGLLLVVRGVSAMKSSGHYMKLANDASDQPVTSNMDRYR